MRQIIPIAKWLAVALMAVAIVWVAQSPAIPHEYFLWQPEMLDCGWSQILDGEEIQLDLVSDYQKIPVGDTLVLTTQIPALYVDQGLFFYGKDVEIAVYVNEELVYSFEMDDDFRFLKTPGHGWNYIDIPVAYSGQTLRLELTSQFDNRFTATLSGLYFISPQNTVRVVWMENGFFVIMGILVLIMAVGAYICAVVWKRKSGKRYYFALANFYLCASLWILPMSGLTNFLFQKPLLSYLCSMFFAIFVPVSIYEFLKVICQKCKRLTALGILFWGNFIVQFILQFTLGISLLDMLFVTECVYGVGCLLGLWMIADHYRIYRGTPELNIPFMTILIMIGGALIEIPVLLLLPERTDLIGIASLTGLICYLVVNGIYLSYRESTVDMDSVTLAQDYRKLQNTGLMYQIKSHFFFNTLNTISALCKSNPPEADRAIVLFSQHMRSHMYLINQHENIPFELEMNLVESTLGIETIRFPDQFSYHIDTPYTDFLVPPLSIQPIVENALLHGLRRKSDCGEVTVRTCREKDRTVVTIADNGIGFDTTQVSEGSSLGIKNLTKRVEWMAGGTVLVESQLGHGTTVTLIFPDMPE